MSAKTKQRAQANTTDDLITTKNEKILKECHILYTDSKNGLVTHGEKVGLTLLPPRKRITVMLMGNHSAGKSSFINWYVEEHVQKTGVAIETQGFAFITSGKRRESLTGNATLHLFPHFKMLQEIEGVVDFLTTEISTSRQKRFSLINFIDTPGLVDGDMKYPFDVNQTLQSIGELCDLIFVFFDPIGQALCKRTLDIVEKLNERHPERMRFFLSKADEAGHESDRQRVLMQIVQEVCKRPGLNKTGFDMPTMYIPNINKQTRCINQIDDACKYIEKTINQSIQNTLNQLEKDCDQISFLTIAALDADTVARRQNRRAKIKSMILSLFGFLLPILLVVQVMVATAPREALVALSSESVANFLEYYMLPTTKIWQGLTDQNQLIGLASVLVASGACLIVARITGLALPTLQSKSKKCLEERKDYLDSHVRPHKQKLYTDYLKQSVTDHEL